MQQPPQQQPQMQQRIHQIPQPSAAPVMYATSMDMNGYTTVYQYPTAAFQQPPPQQFIGADAGYQSNPQFSLPPPAMYNPVAHAPPAPAAGAYSRPPPQQQQTYYTVPHPSMMAHADPPRNPFVGSSKHCLSVFDTPAESSAAYTASWVSSTSSIPPEQKASPDQESNPPTPSEYSNNWHENSGNRASPLVDEFAAGASATSGFSPPLGDNTLDAQLASLNISHADFTANNGKGPMPSGFYGARTMNPQMSSQSVTVHSVGGQMQQQYLTQGPPMYYQGAPPQAANTGYYVPNQPPPNQHMVDVSGSTWADMVKKGGCTAGETRSAPTGAKEQHCSAGNQNSANVRRYNGKQHPGNNVSLNQNGRISQNQQHRRKQRTDRNASGNGNPQGGDFGTFIAPGSKPQSNYASPPSNQYLPSHSPVAAMNGGTANNTGNSFNGAPNGGQQFNYPPPFFLPHGMSVPPPSTSTPMAISSGNNSQNPQSGFRSTWLDERLPALDMVIRDNAISAQAIVQEKMMKNKSGTEQFVVPPPNMMVAPPTAPGGMHRFITPGAFGMTAFIPMCPTGYQQHSSSPPQGQYGRTRRVYNVNNGRTRCAKPLPQHPSDTSDKDKDDPGLGSASEETIKPEEEEEHHSDSGKRELEVEKE